MNDQSYKCPSKFNLPKYDAAGFEKPYIRLPNGDVVEAGNLEYLLVTPHWLFGWVVDVCFRGDNYSYTEFFLFKRDAIAYREAILETLKSEVQ